MELVVAIAALVLTLLGFVYLLAFGQVPLKEALPYGIRFLFGAPRRWKEVARFKNRVTAVAFSSDGKRIAAGGFDSTIHLIDHPGKRSEHFPIHEQVIRALCFGKTAGIVYSCADDGRVLALDSVARKIRVVGQHEGPVYSILVNVDETLLYAADRTGCVCAWNVQSAGWQDAAGKKHLSRPNPTHKSAFLDGPMFALTFMATEDAFLCAGVGGKLFQFDARSFSVKTVHTFSATVFSLSFDPHHNLVYAACADGRLHYFDFTDSSTGFFEGHTDSVRWVLSKPPNTVISSSKDRTIRIWKHGEPAHTIFEGHKDYVYQISLSPDGTQLASACGDGSVYVWDLPV